MTGKLNNPSVAALIREGSFLPERVYGFGEEHIGGGPVTGPVSEGAGTREPDPLLVILTRKPNVIYSVWCDVIMILTKHHIQTQVVGIRGAFEIANAR